MFKTIATLGLTAATLFALEFVPMTQKGMAQRVGTVNGDDITTEIERRSSQSSSSQTVTITTLTLQLPSTLAKGFDRLAVGETEAAFDWWFEHSHHLLRQEVMANNGAEILSQFTDEMLGTCVNYSVLDATQIDHNIRIYKVASQHQNMSVFWGFILYRNTRNQPWEITYLGFNTDPEDLAVDLIKNITELNL